MTHQKLLFISPDEFSLTDGAILHVCPPLDRQIVLKAERPWESRFIAFYTTILKIGREYRLYYTCRDTTGFGSLCLAVSQDGVHFQRPDLGLREYHGSRHNNMLNIDSLEGNVLYSPEAPRNERFLYLAHTYPDGFFLHTSADGIHWEKRPDSLLNRFCDSQNIVLKNPEKDGYLVYARGWQPKNADGSSMRTVVRLEWPDLHKPLGLETVQCPEKWGHSMPPLSTEGTMVMACDTFDHPRCDVYTSAVERYGDYYLAFPSLYWHELSPKEGGKYENDGDVEVMFYGSRDGYVFHRYDRAPYIRNELCGRFACKMAYMGSGVLRENGCLRQYGTIYRTRHGETPERDAKADGSIVVYDQRLDGFVCVLFPYTGGQMRTMPWEKGGRGLFVNADCGVTGWLSFALADEQGNLIPGFDFTDAAPLHINAIHYPLQWRGGRIPEAKVMCVLVKGANARLFSMAWE